MIPTLPQTVRRIRKSKHLTMKQLSKLSGVGVSTIEYMEAGTRYPALYTLIDIARALDTTVSELLKGVE